jgi:TonB family protein
MLIALLAMLLLPNDPALAAPVIDGVPRWLSKPSRQQFADAYPPTALREGLEGRAVIYCAVLATGRLSECVVVEETPQGKGFGAAALTLAPYFQLSAKTPIEGASVRIPLIWKPS